LDLSLENIFLSAGAAKIGDLGACIVSDRRFIDVTNLPTGTAAAWGTPEYMSPEQFRARDASEVDARANVYSVGVMVFELLDRRCRRPFNGSFDRLRDLHLSAAPPALLEVAEGLSLVVMRCLEKDPDNRFQGADELLDALKAATSLVQKSATEATRITSSIVDARPTADLWRQCIETHGSGRLGEARSLCKEILNQQPDHPEAAGMLKELEHRYEQTTAAYEAIRRDIGRRNARDLAEIFLKFQGYPDHPLRLLVAEELDQTITRAKRLTDEASAASESGNLNDALNLYRLAYNVDPNPVVQCSIDLCKQLVESNSRIQALRDSIDPNSR
jgi:serine/threonine protein kinase